MLSLFYYAAYNSYLLCIWIKLQAKCETLYQQYEKHRMTPYLIFVIVLTVGYIIYYAYNIIKDLHGKKDTDKATEETFEVGLGDDAPTATPVRETATGFSLGEETTNVQPDTIPEPTSIPTTTEKEVSQENSDPMQRLQDDLEEADVTSSNPLKAPQLEYWMMRSDPSGLFYNPAPKITQRREQF